MMRTRYATRTHLVCISVRIGYTLIMRTVYASVTHLVLIMCAIYTCAYQMRNVLLRIWHAQSSLLMKTPPSACARDSVHKNTCK